MTHHESYDDYLYRMDWSQKDLTERDSIQPELMGVILGLSLFGLIALAVCQVWG